uniref:Ribonuclease H-like domain-containing protein n=1 Tax=Tanacetum cinerariifolium TaxID=118510 RepID=A0A6L2MHM9_TANCI|nr:ribonuclease H-like domain-containing protein [Tanacetum cinerariifolium]
MKIEHYLSHTDYPIWQVIQNGYGPVSVITDTNGMIKVLPPKTAKEVVAREREGKTRTTLLMALAEDHLAKFHKMADAKELWEAIKSRFGGNDESKKMQKYLLKQQFKGTNPSSSNTHNVAFVSADNISSINDVSTTYSISSPSVSKSQNEGSSSYTNEVIHSFFVNQSSAPQLDYDDTKQINDDDIEKMDLKWQVAVISIKIKKFYKRTGRKLQFNTKGSRRRDVGYNGNKARDYGRRHAYQEDSKALVTIDGEDIDWSIHVEEDAQNYALMAYSSSNLSSDNESVFMNKESDLENNFVNDRYAEGMHTSVDESDAKTSKHTSCESNSSLKTTTSMPAPIENAPKVLYEPKVWSDALIIKEYESDSDDDLVCNLQEDKEKPSFASTNYVKHVKPSRGNVKETDTPNHSPKIEKQDTDVKALADCNWRNKRKSWNKVFNYNSGLRHMIGNKVHLVDYQKFEGGSVAFGCSNERITGIKREYSNARTPQQNRVAERKNKTLIEAARTMVLVTKPQNKIPYELLTCKQLIISYLRPFGCHVTILNTIDQLGKFDGKSDSGFLAGYSLNSKAFREELEKLKRQEKEANDAARKEATHEYQDANTNITNLLNAVSTPISTVGPSRALNDDEPSYPGDLSMPHLKDIYASPSEGIFTDSSYDDEGMVTDLNNSETTVNVSLTPITRILTIHPKIIVNVSLTPKTRILKLMLLIEAISIFLAFASYMGFIVYQMDVKSALLYGIIDEEVYVTQPPGFVDPKFPNKVYKVVNALYGLQQAPRACVKTASTPIETQKPLVKDEESANVDVTPKTSHLQAVKKIFRYLKGQPKLGNPQLEFVNFLAGDIFHSNAKSRLLWLLLLQRDAYEKKLIQVLNIHTDDNVADLLAKAFVVSSKELASPKQTALEQTAAGKENSNPLVADSLPITILFTMFAVKLLLFMGYA